MAWWKKLLIVLSLIAFWMCGLFFVGGFGYSKQYLWLSLSILVLFWAAIPFWRSRSSSWYWPTIVVLGLIHLIALYVGRTFIGHGEMPPKWLVQAMVGIDIVASWGVMIGVSWLITRRFPPWHLPWQ